MAPVSVSGSAPISPSYRLTLPVWLDEEVDVPFCSISPCPVARRRESTTSDFRLLQRKLSWVMWPAYRVHLCLQVLRF
jgi:hypothetical protein